MRFQRVCFLVAAAGLAFFAGYSFCEDGKKSAVTISGKQDETQGVWVQAGSACVSVYGNKANGDVAVTFYSDIANAAKPPYAAQFAIAAGKNHKTPEFQIVDENGKVHFIPVTALIKLAEKK